MTRIMSTLIVIALLTVVAIAQPLSEADLKAIEDAQNINEHYRQVCLFFDEYLAEQSKEYRDAVKRICLIQARNIEPTRFWQVTFSPQKPEPGAVAYIGSRFRIADNHFFDAGGITIRDHKVVGLTFTVYEDWDTVSGHMIPTYLNNDVMNYIARIPTLESLDLSGGSITDVGLAKLAGMHSLKELTFNETWRFGSGGSTYLTGSAFQHLHGLTQLEVLDLANNKFDGKNQKFESDIFFEALSHYPKLKKLNVGTSVEITPQTMQWLSQCRELEELRLSGTMPEPCLEILAPLSKLKNLYLGIGGCNRSYKIPGFPALDYLEFTTSGNTDVPIVITIADLPELRSLWLSVFSGYNCQVVIFNTPKLMGITPHFREIGNTIFRTEHFIEEIAQPQFPNGELSLLSLMQWGKQEPFYRVRHSNASELPEGIKAITRLTWFANDTPEVLPNLVRTSPNAQNLALINFELSHLTQELFEAVRQLNELEETDLHLIDIDMTPEVFETILPLDKLQALSLTRCTLPDMRDLLQIEGLRRLNLLSMELPAEFGHFPRLEELTLRECTSPIELSLINLPAVVRIDIWSNRGRPSLLVKDAPHLEYFRTVVASWDSMVFENCPSLRDGHFVSDTEWNRRYPGINRLDLRGTQIRADHPSVKHIIDAGVVEVLVD